MTSPLSASAPELEQKMTDDGLAEFTEYFVKNYPGPDTIITIPAWHAPKIFRAAQYAIRAAAASPPAAGRREEIETAIRDTYSNALRDAALLLKRPPLTEAQEQEATEKYVTWYLPAILERFAAAPRSAEGEDVEKLRSELKAAEESASGGWECLMMVREALVWWYGEEHMKAVPPMFFNDAILNAFNQVALAGQYLGRDGINESTKERRAALDAARSGTGQ